MVKTKSKNIIWIMILAILVSLTGCDEIIYERKECEEHVNDFVHAFIDRNVEKLRIMCPFHIKQENMIKVCKADPFVQKTMEKASCEIYTDNIQQKNHRVSCDCFFTIPDYTKAYRSAPSLGDFEYFEKAIDEQPSSSYIVTEVSITFWVINGYWINENIPDVMSTIYQPMYHVLTEGRHTEDLDDSDSVDEGAVYNKVDLSKEVFCYALSQAGGNALENVTTIEKKDLKKNGYDPLSMEEVLYTSVDDGSVEYKLFVCYSQVAARAYFLSHSVQSESKSIYHMGEDWGYCLMPTEKGNEMVYWRRAQIVIMDNDFSTGTNDPERFARFWRALAVL